MYATATPRRRLSDIEFKPENSGFRETVPMDLLPPDPGIPQPEVRELYGEEAMRMVLEAQSRMKGRA